MKRNKLFDIISVLLHFHPVPRKRWPLYYGLIFMKIRNIARNGGFYFHNFSSNQKNIISYIKSRNMRKTLTPSSLNEKDTTMQHEEVHVVNKKEILNLVSPNWEQLKTSLSLSTLARFLKFHTVSGLQGKAASNKSKGKPEESEAAWGGPEAFKLILHITNNFNEVIQKYNTVLVFFHAHWCPHCSRLKRPYGTAALMAKEAKLETVFAAFDVTVDPEVAVEKGVVGIPLIYYYKKGKLVTPYKGQRNAEELFKFVKNPPEPPPFSDSKKQDI